MHRLLFTFLWTFLLGNVLGVEPPHPGYKAEVLQWEVPISVDGRTAVLNGTVQQVYQQMLDLNPDYEDEFGPVPEVFVMMPAQASRRPARAPPGPDTWADCGRFDPAKAIAIWEGINHLNHVSGRPVSRPGPGVCGRVSCSYNSAIWWCNDQDTEKSLSSFHEIASSVQSLTMNCTYWSDSHLEPQVAGQQFHADKWSTIIKGAIC